MKLIQMTRISWIARTLLCALVLTACGGSDDTPGDVPAPIPTTPDTPSASDKVGVINLEPSISGLGTRGVTRGTIANSWLADGTENVAVQIGSVVKTYVVNEKRTMVSDSPFTWEDTGLKDHAEQSVAAWYPYTASLPTVRTVSANQASAGLDGSDFMYAKATIQYINQGTYVYPITFYHQVSMLRIFVTNETVGDTRTVTGIQVLNTCLSGTFTAPASGEHGTWATTTGSEATITTTADTDHWKAVTIPQTLTTGTDFVAITLSDGNVLTFSMQQDFTMQPGKIHDCRFKIKGHTLTLTTEIHPWQDATLPDDDPGKWVSH